MTQKTRKRNRLFMAMLIMLVLVFGNIGLMTTFADTYALPDKGWDRLVGGEGNDTLQSVVATADGATVSVGGIGSDAMILKTDERGTTVWKTQIGGSGTDVLNSVVQLPDGSFLAAGSSTSSHSGDIADNSYGGSDGWIVKFDKNGIMQWNQLVGGSNNDGYQELILTSDDGFLAAGYAYSSANGLILDINNKTNGTTTDGYIAKFNKDGDLQWDNLFGSSQAERFMDVIQTEDGGFVAAGYAIVVDGNSNSFDGEITDHSWGVLPYDALLVKFDESGEPVWHNLFGSVAYDNFNALAATADGGFVAAGRTGGLGGDITTGEISGNATSLIAKFNGNGVAQWNRAFTAGGVGYLSDVMVDPAGGYLAAGNIYTTSLNGLIAKISETGTVEAYTQIKGNGDDSLYGIAKDTDGRIVVAGIAGAPGGGEILSTSKGMTDGLLAHYGETLYNITFEENGGTAVADQTVAFGDAIADPGGTTRTGYTFVDWYADPDCTQTISYLAPILEDTTLYAKWFVRVLIDPIVSDDLTINGTGQPEFQVKVTLPDGSALDVFVEEDGTWEVDLPKTVALKGGDIVKADQYNIFGDGVLVSSDEVTVVQAAEPPIVNPPVEPPETGDGGTAITILLFGLFLAIMIMIGVTKGPRTNG